jgi:putative GTP pyrophosphokinase
VHVPVEVQFRTIAMDFWASLEHKIYYKYDKQVPQELLDELSEAAVTASDLDARMERLHRQIRGSEAPAPAWREVAPSTEPQDV